MYFLRVFPRKIITSWLNMRNISSKSNQKINAKIPVLYGDEVSPPVRFVIMTASALSIELEFHKIDLFQGENKSEFYKKINPLMKVPALSLKNEIIRDSHAIALYLCRISKCQDLYPTDNVTRTLVDDFLYFNASALFPVDSLVMTQFFSGKWPLDRDLVEKWNFLINYLESRLRENTWLVGNSMTLSDICCVTTITSAALLIPTPEKCVKVQKWINRMKKCNFYKYNESGLERLNAFINQIKISRNDTL